MEKQEEDRTIVVMPETSGFTLCVKVMDLIRATDQQECLTDPLKRIVEKYGHFNLLIYYDDNFRGYTPEAADGSMNSIIEYGKYAKKLAYVNPSEKKISMHKIAPDMFGGETKFFDKADLQAALDWVKT